LLYVPQGSHHGTEHGRLLLHKLEIADEIVNVLASICGSMHQPAHDVRNPGSAASMPPSLGTLWVVAWQEKLSRRINPSTTTARLVRRDDTSETASPGPGCKAPA
jgi:hypothetical protein